ncbi:MAG: carnitine 3-dehydrogenase [Alphaproteobacteria bacterium]|nr:carnitine 3-dehydrogenase [Alphaproteobacteria bacterium]
MTANRVEKVAVVGTGVIGAGWAARLLHFGIDVVAADPAPGAEDRLRASVANAEPALAKLTLVPIGKKGTLEFVNDLKDAVEDADLIQESASENEALKRDLLAQVSRAARPDAIIASSSSGLLPSRIQADCVNPARVLIGHPFNPVYLLPLVELVGGEQTSGQTIEQATEFYRAIGMHPLHVRNEIEGYISDRLQEALWREALHLVNDGVATTDEIDQAVIYGPGLRWAFMGTCLTFHLAGGEEGMRHMLRQFGPALKLPWTKLEAPDLTDRLVDRMVEQTQEQAESKSIRELEQLRDDCLVAIMQSLREFDYASGRTLNAQDRRLYRGMNFRRFDAKDDFSAPLRLHEAFVRPEWVDYNGHMTESRYLQIFGDASDALFRFVGVDDDYHARGFSYYTVETHIMNLREVAANEPLYVTTQILGVDEKRLHFFHSMHHADSDENLATAEQMVLHVDMEAGKTCPAPADVLEKLQAIFEGHRDIAPPSAAGRSVGAAKTRTLSA